MERYNISVGGSARSVNWKRKSYTWPQLVERLSKPKIGDETVREYDLLARSEKAIRKDVGGFVGGTLSGANRTKKSVTARSLITLDVDYADDDFFLDFSVNFDCAAVLYGTRSDRPGKRRFRLIIPLDREIEFREEYEACARKVAEILGIELFDPTTFQAERLMYWGSVSSDQKFSFLNQPGDPLCVDKVLAEYGGPDAWKDTRLWAFKDEEEHAIRNTVAESGNPLKKPGLIGAFCRVYTIQEAIEKYLNEVYEDCGGDRYTYLSGTSAAGMVVYDDVFAFSHHSTDPIGDGHTYNAYDLVKTHLFGHLQKDEANAEMSALVRKDPSCIRELVKVEDYLSDFDEVPEDCEEDTEEDGVDWDLDNKGNKLGTINNLVNAFRSDKLLNKLLAYDLFRGVVVYTRQPFFDQTKGRDDILDDTGESLITTRIERLHGIYNKAKLSDAIEFVASENAFHPIKKYLETIKWDGTPRIDKFMTKYMGAEDNIYSSEAFRKMLVGAIARIYEPGIKFDTALVMVSHQGAAKSTLVSKLSKGWFSDSLSTLEGTKPYEMLQFAWLVELADLSALRKTDIEIMKNFITKREDTYRGAYQKRIKTHKRRCVFFGSTNDDTFLKDQTGNRRFFPVAVHRNENTHLIFEPEFDETVNQLWAEAMSLYAKGESLLLSKEAEAIADDRREEFTERSPLEGLVEGYVNMLFPEGWDTMSYMDKRDFVEGIGLRPAGVHTRDEFCAFEIWCEALGNKRQDFTPARAREIGNILARIGGFEKRKQKIVNIYGRQTVYVRLDALTDFE